MKSIMTSVFSTTPLSVHEHSITSVANALDILENLSSSTIAPASNEKILFRGQNNAEYELMPALWRPNNNGKYFNENMLIEQFIIEKPSAREKHKSNLELLSYAQHYGLPTRLLDWTKNALVALYFACIGESNAKNDAAIFCLKTTRNGLGPLNTSNLLEATIIANFKSDLYHKLNDASKHDNLDLNFVVNGTKLQLNKMEFSSGNDFVNRTMDVEKISTTLSGLELPSTLQEFNIYTPPKINSRLRAQQGCFTVHMGKVLDNQCVPFEYYTISGSSIIKIIIPSQYKNKILEQLNIFGINKQTLFPELEYQTEAIKQRCFDN